MKGLNEDIFSELKDIPGLVEGYNLFFEQRGGLHPKKWILIDLNGIETIDNILKMIDERRTNWEITMRSERTFLAIQID